MQRLVEVRDGDDAKAVRVLPRGRRVGIGDEEDIGTRVARAEGLLLDAADLLDASVERHLASGCDLLAAVDVGRAELVDDVEGEGETGRRAADLPGVDPDLHREIEFWLDEDAHDGARRLVRRRLRPDRDSLL